MKVIFLDIDGVLNDTPCVSAGFGPRMLPALCEKLNRVISATGAVIVLHSTWRNWTALGWVSPDGFRALFVTHGIDVGRVYALPPGDKAVVIQEWLDGNAVESHVVLDDHAIGKPGQFVQVLIRGNIGLTDADVEMAIEYLQ